MDTSENNIKMCEKATEIQDLWKPPNGAYFPDCAYYKGVIVYKRSCNHKLVSHFTAFDYSETEFYFRENKKCIGIIKTVHHSIKRNNEIRSGFFDVDDSYPGKEKGLVEIRNGSRLDQEEWIPQQDLIWLPYQDQLQKMVNENLSTWGKLNKFHTYCSIIVNYPEIGAKSQWSFEQFWLAFVMKENFNKVWTGEEWVYDSPNK